MVTVRVAYVPRHLHHRDLPHSHLSVGLPLWLGELEVQIVLSSVVFPTLCQWHPPHSRLGWPGLRRACLSPVRMTKKCPISITWMKPYTVKIAYGAERAWEQFRWCKWIDTSLVYRSFYRHRMIPRNWFLPPDHKTWWLENEVVWNNDFFFEETATIITSQK